MNSHKNPPSHLADDITAGQLIRLIDKLHLDAAKQDPQDADMMRAMQQLGFEVEAAIDLYRAENKTPAAPTRIVPLNLLESLLDNTYELKAERHWWKDEPRCGYQDAFQAYCRDIEQTQQIIDRRQTDG